jgi:hypothetical protein
MMTQIHDHNLAYETDTIPTVPRRHASRVTQLGLALFRSSVR